MSVSESLVEQHIAIVVIKEITLHGSCIVFTDVINDQEGFGLDLVIVVSLAIG